ncbi:MAG TPA: GNAT family N-acetyltransferase [Candidatus Udaeobacter sp.]|nr:GNAT family N-acetyltransferase [Candidatus Udaeobacter sp.]
MPLVGDIDLTIRQAQRDDGPALAQLMCELGYVTAPGEMDARLELILSNTAYRTLVAIVNGSVCGMIGTIVYPSYEHNDPGARILALVTSSAQRRRGIGRALIAAAEKDLAQRGIQRVSLNTQLIREDAHKFYESLGYTRNGWRFVKQLSI